MKILLCYMYQPIEGPDAGMSSGDSMANAFKALGHSVATCGPAYKVFSDKSYEGHDIPVPDRWEHPETYTYDEIIGKYVSKYGYKPDFIIQTDPHFYLVGNKPPEIISVYWVMDAHRGPHVFRRMALEGSFNKIFIAQKYYMPVFERAGLDCHYLAWAYDDTRIKEHPEIKAECDIAFIGTTGLLNESAYFHTGPAKEDKSLGMMYFNLDDFHLKDHQKYNGWENRSMEYAERIEHLCRLSKDFDVRIYQRCYELDRFAQVMSRGKIGFHRSLWRDISSHVFEIPAVNRLLIADDVPYLSELFTDGTHFRHYRSYYQPQFPGFDFDYEEVRWLVGYYLQHDNERKSIAQGGMWHVQKNHTFKNRAIEMLNVLFGG